ncbi:DUF4037 domain-containing protein [Photobacterium lipolyticum]|uniref:DUF4037 domain-containing protein n=1 Tax=Photobacterium lipolyticum TaxID=266810 RepID=A0A2T3N0N6_9GAMM|nr:DUF4037 domain-containing protein [Photobacterium lipolyticum]PSW05763.1 DUF4037 domain-containing protein [Photobacterium lipolyticum]
MSNPHFTGMMRSLSLLPEVEAILLAGSRAINTNDHLSDYDVYVYVTAEIPLAVRKAIADKYCSYMEVNNQYWETEDDGVLNDGTEIELIYRDLDWLDGELERTLFQHQASTGYTTCFWSNLINSEILYDPKGKAKTLQEKFAIHYPAELKNNIITKNYPLLSQKMPAYRKQIQKALKRGDVISINHRIAEFLASYFDILFAVNEYPHPGEKRLIDIAKSKCQKLPVSFEQNMSNLIKHVGTCNDDILVVIDQTINNLNAVLKEEGFLVTSKIESAF